MSAGAGCVINSTRNHIRKQVELLNILAKPFEVRVLVMHISPADLGRNKESNFGLDNKRVSADLLDLV